MNSGWKPFWKIVCVSLLVYIIIIILFAYNIYTFGRDYKSIEEDNIKKIQNQIYEALDFEDTSDIKDKLEEITENNAVEIIIRSKADKSTFFETLPVDKDKELKNLINKNSILLEAGGNITLDNMNYELWYCIYEVSTIDYMENFFSRYVGLILIGFLLIFILTAVFQNFLLKPLYNIKKSLDKWQQNEFDPENAEGNDNINRELHTFFLNKEKILSEVHRKNTKLELELGLERERLKNTIKLSRALVHDLKSPIYATLIENELGLEEKCTDEEEEVLYRTNKQLEELLQGINNILKVLREDAYKLDKQMEELDFVEIVLSGLNHIKSIIIKKNLSVSFDGPEKMMITQSKVGIQLLVYNILSNVAYYSLDGSEIEISTHEDEEKVILVSGNLSDEDNIERIKRSRKSGYHIEDIESSKDNRFSSGNGIYLINDLKELLGGEYKQEIIGNKVVSTLILYKQRGDKHEE